MIKSKISTPTIRKRVENQIKNPTDNVAVQQAKSYFSELTQTSGKLIWLLSFQLIMALLKSVYVGISSFFQEMSKEL